MTDFEAGGLAALNALEDAVVTTCKHMHKTRITVPEFLGLLDQCRSGINRKPGTANGSDGAQEHPAGGTK
jgi:hypothetical protein